MHYNRVRFFWMDYLNKGSLKKRNAEWSLLAWAIISLPNLHIHALLLHVLDWNVSLPSMYYLNVSMCPLCCNHHNVLQIGYKVSRVKVSPWTIIDLPIRLLSLCHDDWCFQTYHNNSVPEVFAMEGPVAITNCNVTFYIAWNLPKERNGLVSMLAHTSGSSQQQYRPITDQEAKRML